MGSVFQDARSQFFTANVLDELAFASENYQLEANQITRRIEEVLQVNQMEGLKNENWRSFLAGRNKSSDGGC